MRNNWKWVLGIVLVIMVLFALPFVSWIFMPFGGYGMMGYGGYPMMGAWHMPMMYGGFGLLGMVFAWLIPLSLLVLIGLAIAALVKFLRTPKSN